MGSKYARENLKVNSFTYLMGDDENEIIKVPLDELHGFKNHPFKVMDDEKMSELVESIKKNGVLTPGIVRADIDGGYELISGHRRKRACELAELKEMPVIVKHLDDDEAIIAMVESNSQREEILPSEKAFAYKMKLEAMSHQGISKNSTSRQVVEKLEMDDKATSRQVVEKLVSADLVGQSCGESGRQVHRYIRLTLLMNDLLDMVDHKKLKLIPAVELSYLTQKQQEILLKVMDEEKVIPSLAQAQRLKRMSQERTYSKENVRSLLSKPSVPGRRVTIDESVIMRYFTPDTSDEYIQNLICSLLDEWQGRRGLL
jgi:ParB family chromosome partitioning protein